MGKTAGVGTRRLLVARLGDQVQPGSSDDDVSWVPAVLLRGEITAPDGVAGDLQVFCTLVALAHAWRRHRVPEANRAALVYLQVQGSLIGSVRPATGSGGARSRGADVAV